MLRLDLCHLMDAVHGLGKLDARGDVKMKKPESTRSDSIERVAM